MSTTPTSADATGPTLPILSIAGLLFGSCVGASLLASTGQALQQDSQSRNAKGQSRPEFSEAGVCSRCHVNVVLEWGISGHVESGTTCQECHGESEAHVANERNEIAPDRLPRGNKISGLCSTCHDTGCPETLKTTACKDCHHVHALLNPNVEGKHIQEVQDRHLKAVLQRLVDYREAMIDGAKHVRDRNWQAALGAFGRALKVRPADRRARRSVQACLRRLDPELPGFRRVADQFDPESGLPMEVVVEDTDLHMVLIPGGEFDMGDDRYPQAQPVHTVTIEPFYLGKFELTQGQWQAMTGSNPSRHQGDRFPDYERMPVERVSWDEAARFIAKLNDTVRGGSFRLPTEAEWEYAATTGEPTKRADLRIGPAHRPSNTPALERVAWFRANSLLVPDDPQRREDLSAFAPRPVGTKEPNAFGLFDMQGNVSEWCATPYWPYLFDPKQPEALPARWPTGLRVVRGGTYTDGADALQPTLRHAARPGQSFRWTGLRLARSVPPLKEAR